MDQQLKFTVTSVVLETTLDCQRVVVTLEGADALVQARLELEGEGIGPFRVGETYTLCVSQPQVPLHAMECTPSSGPARPDDEDDEDDEEDL